MFLNYNTFIINFGDFLFIFLKFVQSLVNYRVLQFSLNNIANTVKIIAGGNFFCIKKSFKHQIIEFNCLVEITSFSIYAHVSLFLFFRSFYIYIYHGYFVTRAFILQNKKSKEDVFVFSLFDCNSVTVNNLDSIQFMVEFFR